MVYMKSMLYYPYYVYIEPKLLRNKRYSKTFHQGHMDQEKVFIFYYDTPRMTSIRKIRLIVVPREFRLVVVSECHIYPLEGHSHDQQTLFRIMAWFFLIMVNK